ncbi:hydroxylysine kinase-like [Penaeus japonicus]|uniref:hydroxylysine kinase-like n=1 Tax=Penaeus japonicus TaxID=27405 RepID=UPI001C70CE01|nr:hydroxylysine kinase-like [Penaeus japonicus]
MCAMAEASDAHGLLEPGQIIRPMLKKADVPALVAKVYGLSVVSVKELNSYDDKNYLIQVQSKINNTHMTDLCPHGYVVKVTNSLDSKNTNLIAAQNEMMLFLHSRGINVPKPEKNVHGTYMMREKLKVDMDDFVKNNTDECPSGEYMVRMLTFVPGKILHQVKYTSQLFFECGELAAKMDNELMEFNNEHLKGRKLIWMLENTPDLTKFIFAVRDESRYKMITEILDAWNQRVVPLLPTLDRGMIHGDFNEQNIIVDATAPEHPDEYHVSAIIDFGDIQESCYVFEVAITIMYLMIEVDEMPPNDAGGHVLAGYLKHRALSEVEWSVLRECVAARFAQSLVMGAYSYEQDPGNEYLLTTARRGWDVLATFWSAPKEQVLARWREIIRSYEK